MKCIAYFSVIEPLIICEQFIDKKKAMVTYGNFFYQILLYISIFKAEFTHNWARQKEKENKLALNTKVGQLFLLGLFLRHYFVDSNIRNL